MFEIGQRVFSAIHWKWGTIVDQYADVILVQLDESEKIESFTFDGQYKVHGNRVLFFDEPQLTEKCLKPTRWRAELGKTYYFIQSTGDIVDDKENGFEMDNKRHKCGNYFRTEKEAENSEFYELFNKTKEKNKTNE